MKRYFGAHVSTAGGFVNGLKNAKELGVNAIQMHPSPPQRWNRNPYPAGYEAQFLEELPASGVEKIFFHGVYLINLASPNEEFRTLAINSLAHYLDLMERIGGDGVIFHVGSLKEEPSKVEGYRRAAACINEVLERAPGSARLLLEVAAGSGNIIGDRMEELAEIYAQVEQKERVGFALDTQHLWASGYDLQSKLQEVVDDAKRCFTLEKIWAIHLNDSMTALASRRDRHENLGKGLIGREALHAFIHHPDIAPIPLILETPALKSLDTAKEEVNELRKLLSSAKSE